VATEYNLYNIIKNIDIYIEFKILKVKVPINFLGTVGFSLYRDAPYTKSRISKICNEVFSTIQVLNTRFLYR